MDWKKIIKYSAVIVIIVVLSVLLTIAGARQADYVKDLENLYEKSYYNTLDAVADMEINLSKLEIATSSVMQQNLLKEIWRDSSLAESNLAQLASRDTSNDSIIRFINQLGDYCYYLSAKLENSNGTIDEEEQLNLSKSYEIISQIHIELYAIQGEIEQGKRLMDDFSGDLSFLADAVANINDTTIDYPGLIYDGPFSDGLNDRQPIALEGMEDITKEQAEAKVADYFENYETTNIEFTTEIEGNIPSYIFSLSVDGNEASVQISKKGGVMVLYNAYKEITSVNYDEDECVAKAVEFVEHAGFTDMVPVWLTNNNSTMYINFAYKHGDIIVYSDLIKVKVEASSCTVLGLEAKSYIYNHTNRDYTISKTLEQAREIVSDKVEITGHNLAFIPTEWNTEIMVYEFTGTYKERIYFVYINANTLKEEKILEVVDDGGRLVV